VVVRERNLGANTDAICGVRKYRQWTGRWRQCCVGQKKVNQGLLLVVAELVDAVGDAIASRVKIHIGENLPSSLFLMVEERNTTQNPILGPVPNNVSHVVRVDVFLKVEWMVEERWSWSYVNRVGSFSARHSPLCYILDGLNICPVNLDVKVKECGSNLMYRNCDKFDESQLEHL
jgi:hypothetical protein